MSDDNVHALPGYSVPSFEPVERVVEILTEALELAKRGEIVGIALVTAHRAPEAFFTDFHASQGSRHTVCAGALALGFQIGKVLSE